MGTEAEHAVLLTNYLTGLGRTCYLVLGRGVPEGKTAYCLTIEVSCLYFHLSTCLTCYRRVESSGFGTLSQENTFLHTRLFCHSGFDEKIFSLFCNILICFDPSQSILPGLCCPIQVFVNPIYHL